MADARLTATFEELAMPLFGQLYNFAHWLTQDRNEAEDLVQETYVKALRGFAGFQQGTNFRAWMYRILRNTFLSSRSKSKTGASVAFEEEEEDQIAASMETPETIFLENAQREAVQNALAALPLPFREILLLCDFEEMSYQEISETLAIPMGTVMSRLSRARRALRESLSKKVRR